MTIQTSGLNRTIIYGCTACVWTPG